LEAFFLLDIDAYSVVLQMRVGLRRDYVESVEQDVQG